MSFQLTTLVAAGLAALLATDFVAAQTAAPVVPAAAAKTAEPDYTVSYNLGVVSDYRFRGVSQTSMAPAVQGGADFAHKSGVYLGVWASNVKWVKEFNGATQGSAEVDVYAGFKTEVAKDVAIDLGAIAYKYPGNNSGAVGTLAPDAWSNANTNEFYGAVTYRSVTAKYNRSTGDFLGNKGSKGSNYFDLSAAIDLGASMTLTPHIGRQVVANTVAATYTDYALTLGKDMGNGFSLSGAITGTSASKQDGSGFYYNNPSVNTKFIASPAIVLGAKYSF